MKRHIFLSLILCLCVTVASIIVAFADAPSDSEAILAEYNRLKAEEAGDAIDALLASLTPIQQNDLMLSIAEPTGDVPASGSCGEDLNWALENGTLTISGTGKMASWTAEANAPWFGSRKQIQNVVLEKGVTTVGDYAFFGCTELRNVQIPVGVTAIGQSAFYGCQQLSGLLLPAGLTDIGALAFAKCTSLSSLTIPDGVAELAEGVFYECTELQSVSLSISLTSVGQEALRSCSQLRNLLLPRTITAIGENACRDCTALIGISIPDGVTVIPNGAFAGCKALSSVTLPLGLTEIGKDAFSGTKGLPNILLPKGLQAIGAGAFSGSGLKGIAIHENVKTISAEAFADCSNLEGVTLAEGLEAIGSGAFRNCIKLVNLALPKTLASIAEDAFSGAGYAVPTTELPEPEIVVTEEAASSPAEEPREETVAEETEAPAEETVPAETETPGEATVPEETEAPAQDAVPEETEAPNEETEPAEMPEEAEPEVPAVPCVALGSILSHAGRKVSIPVTISNNPGLISLSLNISWDSSIMTLVEVQDSGLLSGAEHMPTLNQPYRLNWVNDTLNTNLTDNGILATLVFEIAAGVPAGEYPISIAYSEENFDVYNCALEAVALEVHNGALQVTGILPGDVNGDGFVNNVDRALLTRYLAGWEDLPELDLDAADLNGDGVLNNMDRAILSRQLAGWKTE